MASASNKKTSSRSAKKTASSGRNTSGRRKTAKAQPKNEQLSFISRSGPRHEIPARAESPAPVKRKMNPTLKREIWNLGIFLVVLMLLLGLFGGSYFGAVGTWLHRTLLGILGFGSYILLIGMLLITVLCLRFPNRVMKKSKTICYLLMIVCISILMHLFTATDLSTAADHFMKAQWYTGGVVGGFFGQILYNLFGKAGSIILMIGLLILGGIIISEKSFVGLMKRALAWLVQTFQEAKVRLAEKFREHQEETNYNPELEQEAEHIETPEVQQTTVNTVQNDENNKKPFVIPDIPSTPARAKITRSERRNNKHIAHEAQIASRTYMADPSNPFMSEARSSASIPDEKGILPWVKAKPADVSGASLRKDAASAVSAGAAETEETSSSFPKDWQNSGWFQTLPEGNRIHTSSSQSTASQSSPSQEMLQEKKNASGAAGLSQSNAGAIPGKEEEKKPILSIQIQNPSSERKQDEEYPGAGEDSDWLQDSFSMRDSYEAANKLHAEKTQDESDSHSDEQLRVRGTNSSYASANTVRKERNTRSEQMNAETEEEFTDDNGERAIVKAKPVTRAEQERVSRGIEEKLMKPIEETKPYEFPSIDLLNEGPRKEPGSTDALYKNAAKLQEVLQSFNVEATVTAVTQGPAVTRYELLPKSGVRVARIASLADDIALNLAAPGIRIEAPIPGKSAVGIEIPNKEASLVTLREIIASEQFQKFPSKLAFCLGKTIDGEIRITDIAKMPHVLIAGATGSGKSVCINAMLMSLLYKADPKDVKLILIDPKVVELSIYNGIPHLLAPVVNEPKKAAATLNWAVNEMTIRYRKFADWNVRDIRGYNELVRERGLEGEILEPMPQIVIIIDELADLMMVSGKEVEDAICRLAQMARAAGMHLVIATQRPSVDVITGVIKANIPSRLAFSVSSGVDSRTILDSVGAEKLLGHGDMLFLPMGASKAVRIQGAFVSDHEVERVVEAVKAQENPSAAFNIDLQEQMEGTGNSAETAEEEVDEYLEKAIEMVIQNQKCSSSSLQRAFRIGFNRAARLVDYMYERGIVGPEEGSKPRKVLVTQSEYLAMKKETEDEYPIDDTID